MKTFRSDETGRSEQAMSGGFSKARLGHMHDVMAMIETVLLNRALAICAQLVDSNYNLMRGSEFIMKGGIGHGKKDCNP